MKRIAINPWDWSLKFGYNQGEVIEGATRQLICSGQTSVDDNGVPQHKSNMRAQMSLALQNLEDVVVAARMKLGNVTQLKIYTTDMDATLENFDIFAAKFGAAKTATAMTLIGVSRLAMPDLMIEIEAIAQE